MILVGFASFCAVKIQSMVRMYQTAHRVGLQASVVCQIAAIIIQMKVRSYLSEVDEGSSDVSMESRPISFQPESEDVAASRIQSLWRRYCNRKIFFFYKSLVLEKLRGAPSDLLRHIIPREVDLLDKAAGIHIRFRLGGYSFPPKVYFKVFTHRGICDVGAFAPRNYKRGNGKPLLKENSLHTKSSHNSANTRQKMSIRVGKSYFDSVTDDRNMMKDWYVREENNFWRPIAERTLLDTFDDGEIVKPTILPFHYSRLHRKQDVEILRKRRKRDWMAKAYRLAKEFSLGDQNGIRNPKSVDPYYDNFNGKSEEKKEDDDVVRWR